MQLVKLISGRETVAELSTTVVYTLISFKVFYYYYIIITHCLINTCDDLASADLSIYAFTARLELKLANLAQTFLQCDSFKAVPSFLL